MGAVAAARLLATWTSKVGDFLPDECSSGEHVTWQET